MDNKIRVEDSEVGLFMDRIQLSDLRSIESTELLKTKYYAEHNTSIFFEDVHYDEECNIVYSIGSYMILFFEMLCKKRKGDDHLTVRYSFRFEEEYETIIKKIVNSFKECRVSNNKIEFYNSKTSDQSYLLINILEFDYYLSKQLFGMKNKQLDYNLIKRGNPDYSQVQEDEFDYSAESIQSFKEMIEGFKRTKEFSYEDSPNYFINYFIERNNLSPLEQLNEKDLKKVYKFLKTITKISMYYLIRIAKPVDVSKDLEKTAFAYLYRSLEVKLTFGRGHEYLDFQLREKVQKDNSLKFKIYDDGKNEMSCEDLKYFYLGTSFYFPFDEIIQKNIHFVEIIYEEQILGEVSLKKYRELAVEEIRVN